LLLVSGEEQVMKIAAIAASLFVALSATACHHKHNSPNPVVDQTAASTAGSAQLQRPGTVVVVPEPEVIAAPRPSVPAAPTVIVTPGTAQVAQQPSTAGGTYYAAPASSPANGTRSPTTGTPDVPSSDIAAQAERSSGTTVIVQQPNNPVNVNVPPTTGLDTTSNPGGLAHQQQSGSGVENP
jgi:hypothetical protein